ncbi:MAG: PAS domain-containing protein [Anaerolineae bacterium]|nr:PAS domain-containing protein [Anaerolineae bacterium]
MKSELTTGKNNRDRENLLDKKILSIFDNMLVGVQIFDENLTFLYINEVAEQQYQVLNSELISKSYKESCLGIENPQVYKNFRQCLDEQISTQFEIEFKLPDGSIGWFNLSIQPIKEGILILSVEITTHLKQEEQHLALQAELKNLLDQAEQSRQALLTIVEDQKLALEEIKLLNKTLDDRVHQRTAQLKATNEELESFAYSISHDLRAPLRAIDGYSRILEQDYTHMLDVEGVRLLNIVRSSTKGLDRLITDLLSLSRVGRSDLKLETLDMKSMVDSIYQDLIKTETQEKIYFTVHELPSGYGDSTLINLVWKNLISNAIKYSLPKEHIVIEIFGTSDSEKCTYSIKDNGVGFNPDYKEKLFGLFQRLHKASDFEGTGAGLAIVHRIVTRHNGKVWGNGEVDVGAEFSFTLPKKSETDK